MQKSRRKEKGFMAATVDQQNMFSLYKHFYSTQITLLFFNIILGTLHVVKKILKIYSESSWILIETTS